jgi:hypothetical protein
MILILLNLFMKKNNSLFSSFQKSFKTLAFKSLIFGVFSSLGIGLTIAALEVFKDDWKRGDKITPSALNDLAKEVESLRAEANRLENEKKNSLEDFNIIQLSLNNKDITTNGGQILSDSKIISKGIYSAEYYICPGQFAGNVTADIVISNGTGYSSSSYLNDKTNGSCGVVRTGILKISSNNATIALRYQVHGDLVDKLAGDGSESVNLYRIY